MSKAPKPHPTLPVEWQDWEGNFDDLVAASGKVLATVDPQAAAPSGSVVRYYQQQGVVGRGTAQGRTRRFTSQELSQVVGAKWLAGNSIPLSLAKSAMTSEGTAGVGQHPAQTLVAQLMKSAGLDGGIPATRASRAFSASNNFMSSVGASPQMAEPLANMALPQDTWTSTAQDYVSLPAGGTVRYALGAGTTVELATNGDIQAQAQALHTLADQLLANLTKTTP